MVIDLVTFRSELNCADLGEVESCKELLEGIVGMFYSFVAGWFIVVGNYLKLRTSKIGMWIAPIKSKPVLLL